MQNHIIKVSIGVLRQNGMILVAQSKKKTDSGEPVWEFPGGKINKGESHKQALRRELKEELNIEVKKTLFLKKYFIRSDEINYVLSFFQIVNWIGECVGSEGQVISWIPLYRLRNLIMHESNRHIIDHLTLPKRIMITPYLENNYENFLNRFNIDHVDTLDILQLRLTSNDSANKLVSMRIRSNRRKKIRIMINASMGEFNSEYYDGLHLPFSEAKKLTSRPIQTNHLLSVSCHNKEEIKHANSIGADFLYLSPINKSNSHPDTLPLGWIKGASLIKYSRKPVYALGGLSLVDLPDAIRRGFQGIAGITTFWDDNSHSV